jgi:hypothetical protein
MARMLIVLYGLVLLLCWVSELVAFVDQLLTNFLVSDVLLFSFVIVANVVILPAAVTVLVWTYCAHANLRDNGLSGLNYSPAWSVASYFVPLANLVVPFRAMRELWNRSEGEDQYQASGNVPDVGSWWTCFVAGNAIEFCLLGLRLINTVTPLKILTPPTLNIGMIIFATLLLVGSAFFLFRIIGAITRAQTSLVAFDDVFA